MCALYPNSSIVSHTDTRSSLYVNDPTNINIHVAFGGHEAAPGHLFRQEERYKERDYPSHYTG